MTKTIITVSSSDSSGASGIQADTRTIMALGGYAASVVTQITADSQDTYKILYQAIPENVAQQFTHSISQIGADAIKIAHLGNQAIIDTIADCIEALDTKARKILIDPSLLDRSGTLLIEKPDVDALKRRLFIHADVLTPNRYEAEILTGMPIQDLDDMRHAAEMMITFGAQAVILKGGQLNSQSIVDLIVSDAGETILESPVIKSKTTHGAGDTLSAAITYGLTQGLNVEDSMRHALNFLNSAIETALALGEGEGPVNQGHVIETQEIKNVTKAFG